MNTFSRNARFQGHFISAIPNRYRCAECSGQLVYAGDNVCEKVSCITSSAHNGLVKNEDLLLVKQEKLLTDGETFYSYIRNLPDNSPILGVIRNRNAKAKSYLFGDNDD